MAITIGPPTQQGQQDFQRNKAPNLMLSDPRDPTLDPGVTPAQAEVGVSADVLPSRVTGQMDEDTPEGYTGLPQIFPKFIGDLARGANDYILALLRFCYKFCCCRG